MENKFDQLVLTFQKSSLSTEVIQEIILSLQQQQETNSSLSSFISHSFDSLLILEQSAWRLLSEDYHQWLDQPYHQQLLRTLATLNKKLIYHCPNIEVNQKLSLLFPETIEQVNNIVKQIDISGEGDADSGLFVTIINLWLDNYSYFLFDNPLCGTLPVIDYLGKTIAQKYFMSEQYKLYLKQLRQPDISQIAFTPKMLFYIRTCSFFLYAYLPGRVTSFPYGADEIMEYIGDIYLKIIHIHSYTVSTWNKELLGCVAQLIGFVTGCCWWDGEKGTQMKILFPSEQLTIEHVYDLIRIIGHKPFYKQTKPVRSNDETALMDATVMLLLKVVQVQNITWLFRSDMTIRNTIAAAAEAALNDEVSLCGYAILGEALADEDLKDLKISDNICNYFFECLEKAWSHPLQMYKLIPIGYFLRGFQTLAKSDSIQQCTAKRNGTKLCITMCDRYPVVFDIIWALSFNKDIQQQLRSNTTFMSKLAHLDQAHLDQQMRKITQGILWNLQSDQDDRSTSDIKSDKTFDIMISYSHKDKQLCKQIYNELIKSNYRVWIDFDQMHGNVMDAMAQAIESSQTVIICMSDDYRKSNYCRAEAQYAFQRQRKIVPVLLQKHYKPDGWLLFLIGQILYIDFNKHEFNRAMEMLHKELKTEDMRESYITPVEPKQDAQPTSKIPSSTSAENILEWTAVEVHEWLVQNKLQQMSRLLSECDGGSLVCLGRYLNKGQPDKMLNFIQQDAVQRINENISLIELCRFQSLLDKQRKLAQNVVSARSPKTL